MKTMSQVLTCRLSYLPPEFFVSPFQIVYNTTAAGVAKACMMSRGLTEIRAKACYKILNAYCPSTIFSNQRKADACHVAMMHSRLPTTTTSSPGGLFQRLISNFNLATNVFNIPTSALNK